MLKTSFLKSHDRGEPNTCTWDVRECSLELTQHVQHVASRCTSMAVWITAFAGPSTQIQQALASKEKKKKGFSLIASEREIVKRLAAF